ncbi:TetR/AcrR family transcriptional regulator [Goodfellowiella coeruleoviolacea]|uniref:Transcriptional regulator, TetR family n=1 Tax=Goodfellowiella coeruleoviolacea TaxID=334858 RepID=A0AAE3GD80_9PSEU|nr:TetR/AcrR family transcriptional regulator [Goodfellowiella coeruleoviolacea]MCP2164008.1 transcriptional regulator, TetR family [Goodfellowiella coeruleoviolacea]
MSPKSTPTPPIWLLPEPPERQWGLGRPEIVRAAIEIADEAGAAALTMRAVAAKLGSSTPMSLYRYVHSKDGLVDLMLDAACAEVSTPDQPGADWRAEVTELARARWAMVKRHPWFAELVHSRPPASPNACRYQEFYLATFARLGQDLARSVSFYRLIDGHVLGLALQQVEEQKMWRHNSFTSLAEVRDTARAWWGPMNEDGPYPNLVRLMRGYFDGGDGAPSPGVDEQFELGLGCLLDGIAARL